MSDSIHRGLTGKDIDQLIIFAIDNDVWGFFGGEDEETNQWVIAVSEAADQIDLEAGKELEVFEAESEQ